MKLIERTEYLDVLKRVRGTPDIKVVTGIHRSGKSKLLDSFATWIGKNDKKANVIKINFNLSKFKNQMNSEALEEFAEQSYRPKKNNYLLIDEVQLCESFEKALNSLHASEKYDIYVTGSNAFLLSSDLATLFTERTFEIQIFPFSFAEYTRYYKPKNIDASFDAYVKEGGMAGSYLYKMENEKFRYIGEDVFNTLVVRDIVQKYKIRNKVFIEKLIDFLMDNVGNITSTRNIAKTISAVGDATNHKTIGAYIDYLCKAFAFYKVRRYDIRGKRYLATEDKYYLCDHSFRYARLGTRNMDYGHIYENIVAMELMRRGYQLYVGVLYKKEIDFVAMKHDEKLYIQVSDNITAESTFEREVTPLLGIKDAYPKILIARTNHETFQYEGIKVVDISRWLLGMELGYEVP